MWHLLHAPCQGQCCGGAKWETPAGRRYPVVWNVEDYACEVLGMVLNVMRGYLIWQESEQGRDREIKWYWPLGWMLASRSPLIFVKWLISQSAVWPETGNAAAGATDASYTVRCHLLRVLSQHLVSVVMSVDVEPAKILSLMLAFSKLKAALPSNIGWHFSWACKQWILLWEAGRTPCGHAPKPMVNLKIIDRYYTKWYWNGEPCNGKLTW